MRYKQGECYSILERNGEAAEVYEKIALYFVEYPSIRVDLYKTLLMQGTQEGLAAAKKGLLELVSIVKNPTHPGYSPLNFYSLLLMRTKVDYALLEDKNDHDKILKMWKNLRSNIYLDGGYLSFDEERFKTLKIAGSEVKKHSVLIEDLNDFVNTKILPIVQKGSSPLKGDTWEKIIGKNK